MAYQLHLYAKAPPVSGGRKSIRSYRWTDQAVAGQVEEEQPLHLLQRSQCYSLYINFIFVKLFVKAVNLVYFLSFTGFIFILSS